MRGSCGLARDEGNRPRRSWAEDVRIESRKNVAPHSDPDVRNGIVTRQSCAALGALRKRGTSTGRLADDFIFKAGIVGTDCPNRDWIGGLTRIIKIEITGRP